MLKRRAISAAIALIGSAVALIAAASKTRNEISEIESRKKNRRYRVKK